MTAHTTPCARCVRLERELARLAGRLDILTWLLHRLCEQLGQDQLAAFLDTVCENEEMEASA